MERCVDFRHHPHLQRGAVHGAVRAGADGTDAAGGGVYFCGRRLAGCQRGLKSKNEDSLVKERRFDVKDCFLKDESQEKYRSYLDISQNIYTLAA